MAQLPESCTKDGPSGDGENQAPTELRLQG
uniref:Uncharacterized protein n=1 Tax=Nelumbo nucifera TaxID=4432 RepID=A0A822ZIA1_NELNU|nr:TPA_asm: hypothetical protein HUJ06_002510 [Nelumbo nucifera]